MIDLAKKHKNRLHIFHVSTAAESQLFDEHIPIQTKRITGEACVHHLFFNDEAYKTKGSLIKWNPVIKTERDRLG